MSPENLENSVSVSLSPLEMRSIVTLALFSLVVSKENPELYENAFSTASESAAEISHERVIDVFLGSLDFQKKEPEHPTLFDFPPSKELDCG